ncbi:MAG: hypothetical protein WBA54_01700 [Acidaminobacteraceae bacterium]
MISIEEYVAKRKKEDHLNEFDIDARNENMKTCVNYIFEYFNNYLNITEIDEKMILKDRKLEIYIKQLKEYDTEVRKWFLEVYSDYGKQLTRYIGNSVKEDILFYIYDMDKEFRMLSYDCYYKLIKKLPFLRDQTELLYLSIKDYHRVASEIHFANQNVHISDEINEWIQTTWAKYQVNVLKFASEWVEYFSENEEIWPASHRKKSQYSFRKYDYQYKQSSNLFNIDSLYRKMPKRPFTKGKKQEFEILMMYYWIHSIEGDDGYWQMYLEKVLPILSV